MEEESRQLLEPSQEQNINSISSNSETETQIQVEVEQYDEEEEEFEEEHGEELVTIAQFHAPPRPSSEGRLFLSKRLRILAAIYLVPTTIALIVVLVMDWGKSCVKPPLRTWASIQAMIQALILVGNGYLSLRGVDTLSYDIRYRQAGRAYFMIRFLNFVWLIWYTVGVAWVFAPREKSDCVDSSPHIYKAVLSAVIMESVIVVLAFFVCCCSFPILWLIYSLSGSNSLSGDNRGLDKKTLSKLTETKKFSENDSGIAKEDANCAICLSNYEKGEQIRILPCNHHFHAKCVDEWLKDYNKACPFCKVDVDKKEQTTNGKNSQSPVTSSLVVASNARSEV